VIRNILHEFIKGSHNVGLIALAITISPVLINKCKQQPEKGTDMAKKKDKKKIKKAEAKKDKAQKKQKAKKKAKKGKK